MRGLTSETPRAAFLRAAGLAGGSFSAAFDLRGGSPGVVAGAGPSLGQASDAEADVGVWVVASLAAFTTATMLLRDYVRDPSRFVPDRRTEGSFLILDRRRRKACFGRDRSACQHLYVFRDEDGLYIGTEMRPFVETLCPALDPLGVAVYLSCGLNIAPFPLYAGLHPVLPGHWLTVDLSGAAPVEPEGGRTFWQVERVEVSSDYAVAVERYADLFLARIRAAVPGDSAGVYLSGGSDSASVMGALDRLGVRDVRAAHMHIPGHQGDLELDLVQRLQKKHRFDLEIIRPREMGGDRMDFIRESCLLHASGSYPTFPGYRLCARHLAASLPAASPVFNGELCILDVGFSTANEGNLRDLRRWLYRGGGRRLAHFGPLLPAAAQRAAFGAEPRGGKAAKLWYALLDTVQGLGRPDLFFAGLKLGFRGFPGVSRFSWQWIPPDLRPEWMRRVLDFIGRYTGRLLSGDYSMAMASMTSAWYSEASNFTMPLDALDRSRLAMCFPFSSADLMDFAASLPEAWSRDKRIQKDMSRDVLGLPPEVSHFQKDHSRGLPFFQIAFSETEREALRETVRAHDFGCLQGFADATLAGIGSKWTRWFDLYNLFCVAQYLERGQSAQASGGNGADVK